MTNSTEQSASEPSISAPAESTDSSESPSNAPIQQQLPSQQLSAIPQQPAVQQPPVQQPAVGYQAPQASSIPYPVAQPQVPNQATGQAASASQPTPVMQQQQPTQAAPGYQVPPPPGVYQVQPSPTPNGSSGYQQPYGNWAQPQVVPPVQAQRKPGRGAMIGMAILAIVLLIISFQMGKVFGSSSGSTGGTSGSTWGSSGGSRSSASTELGRRVDEAYSILESDALHVYTDEELDQATKTAIDGLLEASGDIRAQYFNEAELEQYMNDSSGSFVGVGITLSESPDGRPMVTRVFPDSPASEAGVKPGDIIVSIDGAKQDWTIEEAVSAIRRESGEEVKIVWDRDGVEIATTMQVRLVNRQIVTYSVLEYEGMKVGYICLEQFTLNCASEVRSAIRELESEGVDCYILDLRENPGGYLTQAVEIASMFIENGVIVRIEERNNSTTERTFGQHETDKPLVVLINGNSASASELVAAAFQDHERATIVGEQSYGKGTVQNMIPLSFGGAIKFTIAKYLSPNGNPVDGIGVTPDIVVNDGIRLNDADIIHRLESGEDLDFVAEGIDVEREIAAFQRVSPADDSYEYRAGDDVQLDAALKALLESF